MGARSSCLSGQRIGFRGELDQLQLESFVNGQVTLPLRIGDGDLPLIRLEGLHQPFAADISGARVLDPEKAVVVRVIRGRHQLLITYSDQVLESVSHRSSPPAPAWPAPGIDRSCNPLHRSIAWRGDEFPSPRRSASRTPG